MIITIVFVFFLGRLKFFHVIFVFGVEKRRGVVENKPNEHINLAKSGMLLAIYSHGHSLTYSYLINPIKMRSL